MLLPQLAGETADATEPRRLTDATHLEVLKHEHAESLTQDAVRLSVVAPPVRGRHPEQWEHGHDDERQSVDPPPCTYIPLLLVIVLFSGQRRDAQRSRIITYRSQARMLVHLEWD